MRHPKVSFPGGEAIGKFIVGGPLRSKIKLARESELLTDTHVEFIAALADVRNFYAHSVKNMTMRIDEVAEKLSPSKLADQEVPKPLSADVQIMVTAF